MLDYAPELTASEAASGANSREWFASYDRASSSWRTCQGSLFGGWVEFSETWPTSGMTQNGSAYERQTWVRLIDVGGSSLWLTPSMTPGASCNNGTNAGRPSTGKSLQRQATGEWPTPVVTDSVGAGNRNLPGSKAHAGNSLTDAVTGGQAPRRWPTPNTGEGTRGSDAKAQREGSPTLTGAVAIAGPHAPENRSTPGNRPARSVVLNPAWVSCLMGFPPDWCDIGDGPLKR